METPRSNFAVHLSFLIVLAAMLALKYRLYFASPYTEHGLTAGRLGATVSHLLMWICAYLICLRATRRGLLGFLAAISLLFGILTIPLLGWIGIIVMFILHKRAPRAD